MWYAILPRLAIGFRLLYDGSQRQIENEKVAFGLSNTGGDKRHVT
jgi:hypothetical protein